MRSVIVPFFVMLAMTGIYSHSTPKLDREAAEAVSRLLAKG